ncbi:MAG: chemotaxis protein CheW [Bacteroidetes bacterium]|nr:chemotaxis protein CheW [Bacteroidota bacterium]
MANLQLLVFKLSDTDFAMEISAISRVVDTLQSRFLSTLRSGIEGLFLFEGRVVPVIRLDEMLGFPSANIFASNPDESVIIVNQAGYFLAFRVDSVEGIDNITPETLRPTSETDTREAGLNHHMIGEVYHRQSGPVFKLNPDHLLTHSIG